MGTSTLLVICTALAGLCGLVVGYGLGRLDWIAGKVLTVTHLPKAADPTPPPLPRRQQSLDPFPPGWADPMCSVSPRARININETKFVAPVDTGGMERLDTNELGKTTVTTDGVQDAASRLAQLKGN